MPSSVLRRLQAKAGSRLDLHLHDAGEESDVPVRVDDDAKALRDPTGRYQVLGEIGRGGVGVVYKGRDQDLGRDVAMKVLREEHARRPEIVERFVEEAQIGGQLQHPGIVPVYELGLQHGERPYFAMKLVKGETLAALLARRGDPGEDRRRFLGIFEQVCQTIAYAHARRVVHRDLKPHNVMLGSFGEVQVVDWGFAKVLPSGERTPTSGGESVGAAASVIETVRSDPRKGTHSVVGSAMGTPAYMPPEQARGEVEQMDERSDVFGLGAMLCEILTGAPPYLAADGATIQQAARADLQRAYARIDASGADAALVTLCKQCLSPARAARPESGKQVAEAVGAWLTSVEERARAAQIHAAEAKVRARATVMLAAAAVLLLALGGGGYLYLQHETQQRRDQASQRVATALNEASARLGEARAETELGAWTRALDAAALAEQLAADPDVATTQRDRVRELHAVVRDERDRAAAAAARIARDATMRQRLLAARIPTDDDVNDPRYHARDVARRNAAYAAAFAAYVDGGDLTTMPVERAVAALAGPLAVEAAAALDHWVWGRREMDRREADRQAPEPSAVAATSRLQAIACALDPDPWRNQLRAAMDQSDPGAIVVRLAAAADLETLSVVSMHVLASALRAAKARDRAIVVYERALERFPDDFACAFQLGLMHEEGDRWARAAEHYRIARALRPDMREAAHRLGNVYTLLGDHAAEERMFLELARADPGNAHWHFHLGLARTAQGRFAEAVRDNQRAVELDPSAAPLHDNLGSAFHVAGRIEEALATYRRAVALDPRLASAHNNLGGVLRDLGDFDAALASVERAAELDPVCPIIRTNLARAFAACGRHDEALAGFRRAIELDPNRASTHYELGLVLLDLGRHDDAITSFERAIELDPKLVDAHTGISCALLYLTRFDDVVARCRQVLDLQPNLALAHIHLGGAFDGKGLLVEALASYRRAQALLESASSPYDLDLRDQADRAIDEIELRAEREQAWLAIARGEREAVDGAELASAAAAVHRRGEYDLAARTFERAFAKGPDLLPVWPHRYDAACAAALAGSGKGDGAALDADRRAASRQRAHAWLVAEVVHRRTLLAAGGDEARRARQQLAHMVADQDFAGVRGDAALAALPAAEAAAWRELWQDVGRASEPPGSGK